MISVYPGCMGKEDCFEACAHFWEAEFLSAVPSIVLLNLNSPINPDDVTGLPGDLSREPTEKGRQRKRKLRGFEVWSRH